MGGAAQAQTLKAADMRPASNPTMVAVEAMGEPSVRLRSVPMPSVGR